MIENLTENFDLYFNVFTSFIVIAFSFLIFLKTYKLYRLSNHKGLKIFSYAFLFFAIAFLFGKTPASLIEIYFLKDLVSVKFLQYYYLGFSIIFHYMITLAGFSLVYSLIWREFENYKIFNLFIDRLTFFKNHKEIALYLDSIVVTALAFYRELFWFVVMIIVLLYACFLSYNNYKQLRLKKSKNNFAQFYFFALVLALLGFGSNFVLGFFPNLEIYVDTSLILIFGIFLWGSYRINK